MENARMASGALAELSINWWTRANSGPNCLWYEMTRVCGTKGEAYHVHGRGTFARLHESADPDAVERLGEEATRGFVRMPCGATFEFSLVKGVGTEIPTENMPCSCGNPKEFVVEWRTP